MFTFLTNHYRYTCEISKTRFVFYCVFTSVCVTYLFNVLAQEHVQSKLVHDIINEEYLPKTHMTHNNCTHTPAIVGGCGHSGTTFLQMLLSSHPDAYGVHGTTEGLETHGLLGNVLNIKKTVKRFTALCTYADKLFWVEKTPSNVRNIKSILHAIPHARIIIIYRNGFDVAKSIQQRLSNPDICNKHKCKCNLTCAFEEGIHRWAYANKKALEWENHPRVYFIKFELLLTNTYEELQKLCRFMHISYSPEQMIARGASKKMLSFLQKSTGAHIQNRLTQISGPVLTLRHYNLSTLEQLMVKDKAGILLDKLGYTYGYV